MDKLSYQKPETQNYEEDNKAQKREEHEEPQTIEKKLSGKQTNKRAPYSNLEGQLRLTGNYLDLSDYINNFWSE